MHAACLSVLAIALLAAAPAAAAQGACTPHPVDAATEGLFGGMMRGETLAALKSTLGRAPMMEGRDTDLETLTAQVRKAVEVYGQFRGHECVRETRLGSMLLKREYVAQHDKMLTRWTISYIRLPSGWQFHQISYEDQVSTWTD